MAQFEKTRLHVVSAVFILLGLYATAGLVYALWVHSEDSIGFWAVVAALAFVASLAWQVRIAKKRRQVP